MAENFGSQFADAFGQQQRIGIAEQASRRADQAQQFEQDAARKAEAERHVNQLLTVASNITKAASEAGKDPMTVAGAIQPLIETASQTLGSVYGPEGAARVQRIGQALLARPPLEDKAATNPFQTHMTTDAQGRPIAVITDKRDGSTKTVPITQQTPKNLTGPNVTETGVDYGPVETTPFPATGPTRVAQADTAAAPSAPAPIAVGPPEPEQVGRLSVSAIKQRGTMLYNGDEKGAYAGVPGYKAGAADRAAIANYAASLADFNKTAPGSQTAAKLETEANRKSLIGMVEMKNAIEAFENTALKNGDVLVQLAKKVDTTGIPIIEKWIRAGRQATGDADVSEFNLQYQLLKPEVARILTQPRLVGQLTDTAQAEISKALDPGASAKQLERAILRLKSDFLNRKTSVEAQISQIKDRIQNPRSGSTAAPVESPTTPTEQESVPAPTHKIITPSGGGFYITR